MPRALTLQRTVVPQGDRERLLARARTLRSHYDAAQCHYWLFEDAELRGAFIEFVEAPDAGVLIAAQRASPHPVGVDPTRVYKEIVL
jgi:hypothetical protein